MNRIGPYISKLLRHDPQDLKMDKQGFVNVNELLTKVKISKQELDDIVNDNNKKRFEYNSDETLIRARQGHNTKLNVNIDSIKKVDPVNMKNNILYHGTSLDLKDVILKEGLKSISRKHVHLSSDKETAINVALRKSKKIVIFEINAKLLAIDKNLFLSANNVYLANDFSNKYILNCYEV